MLWEDRIVDPYLLLFITLKVYTLPLATEPANAVANVKMIVSKYTDDGMLAPSDELWNKRHHQCPSIFNLRNHTHYR